MSYGLKYIVPFKTISEVSCEIRIEVKDYAGSTMELTGGATPLRTNPDTSDLLVPIRSSAATLSVFGSDYLQDLYASGPQGVRVTLYVGGSIHWIGFLTPDTFSQDFSHPEFIYEMECVAALSTLKYVEFDLTSDFVDFGQIIHKAMDYAGYKWAYLTRSVRGKNVPLTSFRIASANFYDELGDAMTYYEVLEEMAKFLGCTFTPFKDGLYLLDYAAIRSGYNSYTTIERISSGFIYGSTTLSDLKTVTGYKGTGTKISRIAGKNKAVINCSLYEVDNLLPEFDGEQSVFARMEESDTTLTVGKETKTNKEIRRYYRQPKFEMFGYSYNNVNHTLTQYTTNDPLNAQDIGSQFIRSANYTTDNIPNKLSFANELLVERYRNIKIQPARTLDNTKPVIRLKSERDIITHGDLYFCISLQVMINQNLYAIKGNSTRIVNAPNNLTLNVWVSFKIGDKYYNGTSWVSSESRFSMPITIKSGEQMNERYLTIDNTNTFDTGLGDLEGYIIKAPTEILLGACELTVYDFSDSIQVDPFQTFLLDHYNRFKEIRVDYGIPNEQSIYGDWVNKDSKNDLIYENVIEGDYVEEADEIDLKICTNPDGKLALSSVLEGNNFLEELETDVFGTGQAENILLKRVTQMFAQPRFVIDPILANNAKPWTKFTEPHLNKQFLVAGGEEDVKMERTRYNLIEL